MLRLTLAVGLIGWIQSAVASDVQADPLGLASHFTTLNTPQFQSAVNTLLSQPGRYYTQTLFSSRILANDQLTNANAIRVHIMALSEDQAYLGPSQTSYRSLFLGLNAVFVLMHNANSGSSKLRLNHLSILDPIEIKSFKGLVLTPSQLNRTQSSGGSLLAEQIRQKTLSIANLPSSVDWSTTNAVGPVVNQGTCGCCWAFAAVQVLEARLVISGNGNLTNLSEQQLTSCVYANGCNGGTYEDAWEYVQVNGIVGNTEYPYGNGGSKTAASCSGNQIQETVVSTIEGSQSPLMATEQGMMQAVATGGPIAIAISTPSCFSQYSSGVLMSSECTCYTGQASVDHAVTIVGYGTSADGVPYWKVKNSWGPTYGQGGYVLLERFAPTPMGMCGLLTDPNYPKSVSLTAACEASSPPEYCYQALQPIQYTSINSTTGEPLTACVASYNGEYTDPSCQTSSSLPAWAWVLIGIAIALGVMLLGFLLVKGCERYVPADSPYNIFSRPGRDGYRLLSKEEQAAGKAPLPNSDPRAFGGGASDASAPLE